MFHVTENLNRWVRYHRTLRELQNLDRRELRDLGLNRGELRTVARKAAF